MDPLCHTLVGATLARSGLGRRTTRATAALVIGANLPDLDVLSLLGEGSLGFRRGLTHGLPALFVLPLVLTGVLLLWDHWRRDPDTPRAIPAQVFLLALLGTVTHPFLDWLNVYGMRWLMPFDGTWVYGDSVFIVDPWLWLVLAAGWTLAGRDRAGRRPVFARWALGLASAYIAVMIGVTAVGRRVAARELGLERPGPRQLQVAPPFLASWRREFILDTGKAYRFGEIVWGRPSTVRLYPGRLDKGLDDPLVGEVRETVPLRHLRDWSRFPFAAVEPGPDGPVVRFDDARYTTNGPSFAAVRVPATAGEGGMNAAPTRSRVGGPAEAGPYAIPDGRARFRLGGPAEAGPYAIPDGRARFRLGGPAEAGPYAIPDGRARFRLGGPAEAGPYAIPDGRARFRLGGPAEAGPYAIPDGRTRRAG